MLTESEARFFLANVPGIGNKTHLMLLSIFGSGRRIWQADTEELRKYLTPSVLSAFTYTKQQDSWRRVYEGLPKRGIHFTGYGLSDYPARLLPLPDAPAVLFYKGRLPLDSRPSVAIIGARSCSEYGKKIAKEFGSTLALAGVQIVSGMALGIDGISQQAALQSGGLSYGVLGCGVNICYPQSNRKIYDALPFSGGILSEYLPDTPAKANLFPARNRIISGLSDLLLVVEAKLRSGTLITVDMALEQGKEVFAIPGRVGDALSSGCLKLLSQGASICTSPSDLLSSLYSTTDAARVPLTPSSVASSHVLPEMTPEEKMVWAVLSATPQTTDTLYTLLLQSSKDALSISHTMQILSSFCLRGLVKREAGDRFRRGDAFI